MISLNYSQIVCFLCSGSKFDIQYVLMHFWTVFQNLKIVAFRQKEPNKFYSWCPGRLMLHPYTTKSCRIYMSGMISVSSNELKTFNEIFPMIANKIGRAEELLASPVALL